MAVGLVVVAIFAFVMFAGHPSAAGSSAAPAGNGCTAANAAECYTTQHVVVKPAAGFQTMPATGAKATPLSILGTQPSFPPVVKK
jgi:hypothetical protein